MGILDECNLSSSDEEDDYDPYDETGKYGQYGKCIRGINISIYFMNFHIIILIIGNRPL